MTQFDSYRPSAFRAGPAVAALVLICGCSDLRAQEDARSDDGSPAGAALGQEWLDFYAQQADSFDLSIVSAPDLEIVREPEPLLVYTNPVRSRSQHGLIFLWQSGGRPVCVGAVWSTRDRQNAPIRRIHHELHSLTTDLLRCERAGELMWESGEPGIEWQQPDELSAPASSRPLRMTQMRNIARSITARVSDEDEELRLMTQPLYRYPEDVVGAIDGALFAFVLGTDPELFLLVEAREEASQDSKWSIAFAQFTDRSVSIRRPREQPLVMDYADPYSRTGRYYLMWKADSAPLDSPLGGGGE